jgi:hypothetical protein
MPDITLTELDRNLVLGCIDTMSQALALHDHVWNEGERAIFEQALLLIRGPAPRFELAPDDDDGEEWKKGG